MRVPRLCRRHRRHHRGTSGRSGLHAGRACVESPHSARRYRRRSLGPPRPLIPADEAIPRTAAAGTTTAARYRNIRGVDDVQDHLVHAMEQSHLLDELQIEVLWKLNQVLSESTD
ncbi:uncharacterized protein LOC125543926 isoform X4 [Triticum urartu]|uniref:uncharacterized protein LOC125543926 isoform X4 n=1 Tax=Triticum urartu TaxID=4572 RepID=UPI002044833C|nr:uncharacterized protein LOC125543926 isoform X4 [Triticum urartu]